MRDLCDSGRLPPQDRGAPSQPRSEAGEQNVISGPLLDRIDLHIGVPAVAFSLAGWGVQDFGPAARFARALVGAALGREIPANLLLNVNVPPGVEPAYDGMVIELD